eukprot:GILJ01005852.1.p1 GENE.GILJ01005852.1~~GILJ01005852.1.p1  ORF type:complete len:544 (+),score=72.84 GILJ01005852.1:75-1634(+)
MAAMTREDGALRMEAESEVFQEAVPAGTFASICANMDRLYSTIGANVASQYASCPAEFRGLSRLGDVPSECTSNYDTLFCSQQLIPSDSPYPIRIECEHGGSIVFRNLAGCAANLMAPNSNIPVYTCEGFSRSTGLVDDSLAFCRHVKASYFAVTSSPTGGDFWQDTYQTEAQKVDCRRAARSWNLCTTTNRLITDPKRRINCQDAKQTGLCHWDVNQVPASAQLDFCKRVVLPYFLTRVVNEPTQVPCPEDVAVQYRNALQISLTNFTTQQITYVNDVAYEANWIRSIDNLTAEYTSLSSRMMKAWRNINNLTQGVDTLKIRYPTTVDLAVVHFATAMDMAALGKTVGPAFSALKLSSTLDFTKAVNEVRTIESKLAPLEQIASNLLLNWVKIFNTPIPNGASSRFEETSIQLSESELNQLKTDEVVAPPAVSRPVFTPTPRPTPTSKQTPTPTPKPSQTPTVTTPSSTASRISGTTTTSPSPSPSPPSASAPASSMFPLALPERSPLSIANLIHHDA